MDWIVQHIFGLAPLLDGHRAEQERMSSPGLNWLRDVALAVDADKRLGDSLRANDITEISGAGAIALPGVPDWTLAKIDGDQMNKLVGKTMKRLFKGCGSGSVVLKTGGFNIARTSETGYNIIHRTEMTTHGYVFTFLQRTRHSWTSRFSGKYLAGEYCDPRVRTIEKSRKFYNLGLRVAKIRRNPI